MTKDELTTEAAIVGSTMLAAVLSEYGFKPYGVRGTKWQRLINNESNCQSKIFLHLLNGKQVARLSVADEDSEYIDATDMFETKDMDKVRRFMELVV